MFRALQTASVSIAISVAGGTAALAGGLAEAEDGQLTPEVFLQIVPGETTVDDVAALTRIPFEAREFQDWQTAKTVTLYAPSEAHPDRSHEMRVTYAPDNVVLRVRFRAAAIDDDARTEVAHNSPIIQAFLDDRPEYFEANLPFEEVHERIGIDFRLAERTLRQDGTVRTDYGFGYSVMMGEVTNNYAVIVVTEDDIVTNIYTNQHIH